MIELVGVVVLGICILGALGSVSVALAKIWTQGSAPRHPFCTKLYHWSPECRECELERMQQAQHEEIARTLAARVQALPVSCNVHGEYACKVCIGAELMAQANMQRRYTVVRGPSSYPSSTGEAAFQDAQTKMNALVRRNQLAMGYDPTNAQLDAIIQRHQRSKP